VAGSIEKRLRLLETRAGHLPCDKPGHDGLFLFIKNGSELDTETDAKIRAIRDCKRCTDKSVIVYLFGTQGHEQKPAVPVGTDGLRLESKSFTMVFGRADEQPRATVGET